MYRNNTFVWESQDWTMATYVVLGSSIMPFILTYLITVATNEGYRRRKEYKVITWAFFCDALYVAVNVINSVWRIYRDAGMISHSDCLSYFTIFASTVVSTLYAYTVLATSVDRLIVMKFGKWYYAANNRYVFILFAVPITASCTVAFVNMIWTFNSEYGSQMTSSNCYSSGLIHPDLFNFYYYSKWGSIALSGLVTTYVFYLQVTDVRMNVCPSRYATMIRSNYYSYSFYSVSSTFCLLIPELVLVYAKSKSLVLTTFLYSVMLMKLVFNMIAFSVLHKAIRMIFVSPFDKCKQRVGLRLNRKPDVITIF